MRCNYCGSREDVAYSPIYGPVCLRCLERLRRGGAAALVGWREVP